jgi:hypothetical protein
MTPGDFMLVHIYYNIAWEVYSVKTAERTQRLQGNYSSILQDKP